MKGVLLMAGVLLAGGVLRALVSEEAKGWIYVYSRRLVLRAASRQPQAHRERLEEEWLAELDAFQGRPLSQMAWSIRLHRNRALTSKELAGADRSNADLHSLLGAAGSVEEVVGDLHPFIRDFIRRTRSQGWSAVLTAMGDPSLLDIGRRPDVATDSFLMLIDERKDVARDTWSRWRDNFPPTNHRGVFDFELGRYTREPLSPPEEIEFEYLGARVRSRQLQARRPLHLATLQRRSVFYLVAATALWIFSWSGYASDELLTATLALMVLGVETRAFRVARRITYAQIN